MNAFRAVLTFAILSVFLLPALAACGDDDDRGLDLLGGEQRSATASIGDERDQGEGGGTGISNGAVNVESPADARPVYPDEWRAAYNPLSERMEQVRYAAEYRTRSGGEQRSQVVGDRFFTLRSSILQA